MVGNDGVARGMRGRPPGGVVHNVNVEVEHITQRVNDIELVVSRFQNLNPPIFCGSEGNKKLRVTKAMNNLFGLMEYDSNIIVRLIFVQLMDSAERWWESTTRTLRDADRFITWDALCTIFRHEYSPPSYYAARASKFKKVFQYNLPVAKYAQQLSSLLTYVPHLLDILTQKWSFWKDGVLIYIPWF